jgi:GT2 family glycosyltransferase
VPVSIIIIAYNSAGYLPGCLDSLAGTNAEILVIDNASSDGSAEVARSRGVRVIANSENRGFAGAANQGASNTSGDYLLFLNPDTVLLEGFDALAASLENDPQAGMACGLLLDDAGRPQTGFNFRAFPTFAALAFELLGINRLWPHNPVNRRYRCLDTQLDRPAVVEQPAGACLLVRRSALEEAGGWDESFHPVWFEDVDLCLRLSRAGFHARFEPASRWRHYGAHSVATISFAEKQFFWYRNLVCFAAKHLGSTAALALRPLICVGATARWMGACFSLGGRCSWRAYRAVMFAAITGIWRPTPRSVDGTYRPAGRREV